MHKTFGGSDKQDPRQNASPLENLLSPADTGAPLVALLPVSPTPTPVRRPPSPQYPSWMLLAYLWGIRVGYVIQNCTRTQVPSHTVERAAAPVSLRRPRLAFVADGHAPTRSPPRRRGAPSHYSQHGASQHGGGRPVRSMGPPLQYNDNNTVVASAADRTRRRRGQAAPPPPSSPAYNHLTGALGLEVQLAWKMGEEELRVPLLLASQSLL